MNRSNTLEKVLINRKREKDRLSYIQVRLFPSRDISSTLKIAMRMFKLHDDVLRIWTVNV
jgi:hypothetical protein